MNAEGWAAWVQAVASIIALVAAFLFPWQSLRKQQAEAKEDRQIRVRILANRMAALMDHAFPEIQKTITRIAEIRENPAGGPISAQEFTIKELWTSGDVPDDAFLLGDSIGRQFLHVGLLVEKFNRYIDGIDRGSDGIAANMLQQLGDLALAVSELTQQLRDTVPNELGK